MSDSAENRNPAAIEPAQDRSRSGEYIVVARRYRPRLFDQLVGQDHVAQALRNAIQTNRVGHAYLFTGARGVGKTSTARIFAKALNDPGGPTASPDGDSDIARSIDAGEDVDVLEIDGASNRGIDEIRQLRSNVNVRPSRARFKIYIIDEVHMLTTAAFNALLKTLEEPPEHVKFIFCTTDPEKIPITVLSRCQRFDFAPVQSDAIMARLRYIVDQENLQADDEALHMLARRAGGSMRDSQSLLEQLLSFCGERITADNVHAMLGTARSGRLATLTDQLVRRDPAGALCELDTAIREGVDVGQFGEQLLGYLRDIMTVTVGCDRELLLQSSAQDFDQLQSAGQQMGLETLLAAVQIVDQGLVRMRHSAHPRTLIEMALVRICSLEDLDQLTAVVARVERGLPPRQAPATVGQVSNLPSDRSPNIPDQNPVSNPPPSPTNPAPNPTSNPTSNPATTAPTKAAPSSGATQKKTAELTSEPPVGPRSESPPQEFSLNSLPALWQQVVDRMEDLTADTLRQAIRFASPAPNRIVVTFPAGYTLSKETCERPDRKAQVEKALAEVARQPIRVEFEVEVGKVEPARVVRPAANLRQLQRDLEQHPLILDAKKLFDCEVLRFDPPRD